MANTNDVEVVVVKEPIIVEWLEATRKAKSSNIDVQISESIIRLLNGKALSVAQVASKLRISHEKARRHLFYLWRNGYILRSKHPKEKQLVYTTGSNPVTIIYYTYTLNNGSEKVPFITFEDWVLLKQVGKI
ncbi:MAG: hypothetical protein QW175_04455 [Candidatus Bathyarchaeia archaeon]